MPMNEKEYEALIGLVKLNSSKKYRIIRSKRKKTIRQKKVLESVFDITSYPSAITQHDLSILLSIPPRSVQIWFQNARHKMKCKSNEELKDDNNELPASLLYELVERYKEYQEK